MCRPSLRQIHRWTIVSLPTTTSPSPNFRFSIYRSTSKPRARLPKRRPSRRRRHQLSMSHRPSNEKPKRKSRLKQRPGLQQRTSLQQRPGLQLRTSRKRKPKPDPRTSARMMTNPQAGCCHGNRLSPRQVRRNRKRRTRISRSRFPVSASRVVPGTLLRQGRVRARSRPRLHNTGRVLPAHGPVRRIPGTS